jgi:hypothetical protein
VSAAAPALAALMIVLCARAASAEPPALSLSPGQADASALSAAVAGVERDAPRPEWSAYVPVVVGSAVEWLWERLRPLRALLRFGAGAATAAAWGFVALVALAVIAILWRVLVRRGPARGAAAAAAVSAGPTPASAPRDWLLELERRLDAGDVAGALEALWWVFARRLAPGEVRASWTSGELIARARRPELRPLAVQIDRLRYGPARPEPPDVRALARRVSAGVGTAGARP